MENLALIDFSTKQLNLKVLPTAKSRWCHISDHLPDLQLRVRTPKIFSYFSTETYVVGTQKNRLNETVLLSTQNIC